MLDSAEASGVVPCMLREALDLAEQNKRVFPVWHVDPVTHLCACPAGPECSDPGKHPHVTRWQINATDSAQIIGEWWASWPDANIGLVTGATNGIAVADFDPRNGGDRTLAELEAANGGPFQTVTALSGGGGVHLFFAVGADSRLRNGRGIRPGLDRKGSGGYVVCAPSLHESGQRYAWAEGLGLGFRLLPLPTWLDEPEIERGEPEDVPFVLPVGARELARIDRYARRALDLESNAVRTAPKGTRNDRLNEAAFCLGQLVGGRALEQGLVESVLMSAAKAVGLGNRETQATIRSGITTGMKRPRGVPERSVGSSATGVTGVTGVTSSMGAGASAGAPAGAPANDDEPSWKPTVTDPISGLPCLKQISLMLRARYLELAAQQIVYTWRDILVAGTIGVIAGSPASGKTTFVYLYAVARAARGAPIMLLGREVYPAHPAQRIVIIEAEHSEPSAARKLLASLRLLGLDDSILEDGRVITIARKAVTLGSPAWHEVVQLMQHGLVSDVIVDTIARFAPADANAEAEQVAIYDQVAQALEQAPVRDVPPPTCLLVAHTRKGAATDDIEGVSGSTQRVGQADSVLLAEATREGGRVVSTRVTVSKLREDPGDRWPPPQSFSIAGGVLTQESAPSRVDPKAAEANRLDADAYELAELVTQMPGLGTRELRKVAQEKLGWGSGRFKRIENRLKEGLYGVRLVDRSTDVSKCQWYLEHEAPAGPTRSYVEVDRE